MIFSTATFKWQRRPSSLLPILLLIIAGRPACSQQTIQRTTSTEGVKVITRLADTDQSSPHLMVIAAEGQHQISTRAADQLLGWPLLKGRLTVVIGGQPHAIDAIITQHPSATILRLEELWERPAAEQPPCNMPSRGIAPAASFFSPLV